MKLQCHLLEHTFFTFYALLDWNRRVKGIFYGDKVCEVTKLIVVIYLGIILSWIQMAQFACPHCLHSMHMIMIWQHIDIVLSLDQ